MPRPRKSIQELSEEQQEALFLAQLQRFALEKTSKHDVDRDWQWAYDNLGNPECQPKDAPSISAWELLQFGRDYKSKFMEKALSWHEKKRKEMGPQGDQFEDDGRTKFRAIEKMIKNLTADLISTVKDIVRRDPNAVARTLRDLGWTVVVPKKD
jgi:hypothetical protein